MVIFILFHSGGFRCFKHYHKEYVRKHLKHLFSRQVSYNRFVELKKEAWFPSEHFHRWEPVHVLVSSTLSPFGVCRNQRILIHKTFERIAVRGKSPMGWFF